MKSTRIIRVCRRAVGAAIFVLALAAPALAQQHPPAAAVATAHPLATAAAAEILDKGGNAFDAAVAATAALAVVEPMGSGLGGGGFWLLHRAADGFDVMIDGRERAPLAAQADMYLDADGRPRPRASLDGALAAAIPGTPAALVHLAHTYGRLPLSASLAPAIRYADDGFLVTERYRRLAELRREVLRRSPAAAAVFLERGDVPALDARVRQPELAATLRRIARNGRRGFYDGELARRLVQGVRRAGGIWTLEDLRRYRIEARDPIRGNYRGVRITSAPPPSSGGIVLMEMLNILAGFDLEHEPLWRRQHHIIEAMRLAYRDRARYLGDPDFIEIPGDRLLSRAYAAELRGLISDSHALRSAALPGVAAAGQGEDTTHFSIIDREGNRVAATLSVNYPFGSGFMPPGTGVVLNNEMDDFVMKPGVPNVYGLVGGKANAIAPGKRPLSSMTPTFLESDDAVVVLGTPGGSRIISMVLLATLEFVHGHGDLDSWVRKPRFHHQYLPDEVTYEPGALGPGVEERLRRLGHRLQLKEDGYGNMQAVMWDKKQETMSAASDPRGEGAARLVRPSAD